MRLRPVSRSALPYVPYATAAAAVIAALAYVLIWARGDGLDLQVYRDAVHYWWAGGNPYIAVFSRHRLRFTYPPFAFLALSPLQWTPYPVTQWLLWTSSIAGGAISVALVLRGRGIKLTPPVWCGSLALSCLSVLVLEPVRSAIDYGQIELVLMFVVVADLLLVRSPYRGVLTGIAAAIKLTPLVFGIVLLASRDVKSALRMAVSFCACAALSWLFWPELSRNYWLHDLLLPGRAGNLGYAGNQSWNAILHRPPFPASGSGAAWAMLSLLTLAVSAFVAWRLVNSGQRTLAILPVALAGLLASPISWSHHWVWLLLIPPLLIPRRATYVARPVQVMLWGLVALAVLAPYWWVAHGTGADILGAVMPLWAFAGLAVWAVSLARHQAWPAGPSPSPEPSVEAAPGTPASGPAVRR
jgi:alpha-1,2-mannosyltransferase